LILAAGWGVEPQSLAGSFADLKPLRSTGSEPAADLPRTYVFSYATVKAASVVIYEKSDNVVLWRLWEYVSPAGRNVISDWREGLPTVTRKADFDSFLRYQSTAEKWESPELRSFSGKKWKGLHELRWKSGGVPHRIGGYFAAPDEFVMLIGFTHNQKKYDPPDMFETILKRRKLLQNGGATLHEFKILVGQ